MRRFVRQTRAGFIALASVVALIHLVGVANTPGRVSTLAHGAGRGDDALTFLGPGARRRVLSTCAEGEKYDSSQAVGEQCISCVEGQTSSGGIDVDCDPCSNGEYSNAGTSWLCTPCPAGNFSASPTGSCDACAAGTYQDLTGQTRCTDCLSGYFSAVEGRHRCDRCELGFHSEAGQSECTRCTTGFPCPEDRPKYLELLVVNDQRRCAEFTAFATISSTERAEMHAHTAAVVESAAERFSNGLSQGLTVVLVGQEDWCAGDELTSVPETLTRDYYRKQEGAGETSKPETNTSVLLDTLGVWRDENLETLPSNDVVYLFTGRDLDGSLVGASHAYSVCGDDAKHCGTIVSGNRTSSLGVNECATGEDGVVRCCHAHRSGAVAMVSKSDAPSAAGLVLAHEIGH